MEQRNSQTVSLHELVENQENPRTIEPRQMQRLVESILTFPRMMQLRPIVCSEMKVILGGNMRFNALHRILEMSGETIREVVDTVAVRLTDGERDALCDHWERWKRDPQVETIVADKLTDDEMDEFVIKDNVYFGNWDGEKLKGTFDVDDMQRWGLNPWDIQQEATYEPDPDDEQRIIIVYRSEDAQAVARMMGLDEITKRNFDVDELKGRSGESEN